MPEDRVTAKDVARDMDVPYIKVARTLSSWNGYTVDPTLAAKIRQRAKEMGYRSITPGQR